MKNLRFIIISSIVVSLLSFGVSASQAYTVDGEKTVFLSNSVTVNYNGEDYSAYSSLAEAFSALGTDGGRAIVSGKFKPSDNDTDTAFSDPAGRGSITVTGASGADNDSLLQNGLLFFKSGRIIFDDITLDMQATKYIAAPNGMFTENFRVKNTNGRLFFTGANDGNLNFVDVEISGGIFHQMNLVGVGTVNLGSSDSPGYASITINGGNINKAPNGGSGYSNANVIGNLYYIINGGNFTEKKITYDKLNHASGKKIVIFNNGMDDGFDTAGTDIVVKSSVGGMVAVDSSSKSAPNPVLVLTPDDGLVPYVNGAIAATDGDRYVYTVSASGTYNVSWDEELDGVYNIDGERVAFLSNSLSVSYKDGTYTPFTKISDALKALGSAGGKVIVSGAFTADDNNTDVAFVDPAGRGPVTVTGASGANIDSVRVKNQLSFVSGKTVFDDITFDMQATKYIIVTNGGFTENFKVKNSGGNMFFAGIPGGSRDCIEVEVSGGTFHQMNLVAVNSSKLSGYSMITINGGTFNNVLNGGSANSGTTVNGNLYYIVNGGNFVKKSVVYNNIGNFSGRKVVIFNNCTAEGFEIIGGETIIKSSAGGMVGIDADSKTAAEPVLVFTPDDNKAPAIDGKVLAAGPDGRYTYTLTDSGEHTVTWIDKSPKIYEIGGVRTAFVSENGMSVMYDGEVRYSYTSLTEAVSEIGADGGNIVICGIYNYTSFSDISGRKVLTVNGFDENSVFNIPTDYQSIAFNGGPTVFDNIRVNVENSTGNYIHGNGDITFTKNFISNSNLFISPIYKASAQKSEIYVEGGTFATLDVISTDAQVGTPEAPSHILAYLNGGTINRVNGGWGWSARPQYANLFIYVNGSVITNDVTFTELSTISGTKAVIFNNKLYLKASGAEIPVAAAYDFAVYSDIGGNVTVENENATETPVFILTPDDGYYPFINGKELKAVDGVYKYAPEKADSTVKIYVTWKKLVTVTFDLNGGSGEQPSPLTAYSGEAVDFPVAPKIEKTNCIFIGWNTDKNSKSGCYSSLFENNAVLYAIWLEKLPVLSDIPNLKANGVADVEIAHLPYNSEDISTAVMSAAADPVFISTAESVYAFTITAKDAGGKTVDFANGIDFVIPDYAYSKELLPGEFIRLYRANGDKDEFIADLFPSDIGMTFTAYKSGSYFMVLNSPDTAQYIYEVSEHGGKVHVDLKFSGALSQSGFFGLKYSKDVLGFDSFTYAQDIETAGNSVNEGGYGCYVNEDGLYGDAWFTSGHIDAVEKPVLIGSFEFTVIGNGEYELAFASPDEYGASDFNGFPAGAESAYLPYVESLSVYYQPAEYTIEKVMANVAYIGDVGYTTLDAAFEAVKIGETVKLVEKITLAENTVIPVGTTLEMTGNGGVSEAKLVLSEDAYVIADRSVYDILTADTLIGMRNDGERYIYKASEFTSDIISLDGVQVRVTGVQGLRFIAQLKGKPNDEAYSDYGIIVIPTCLSEEDNTTHATEKIVDISKSVLGDDFKYFSETDDGFTYTVCLINIVIDRYTVSFTARPYIRYIFDGEEYTAYADYKPEYNLSVLDVATRLVETDEENREALQAIIDEYNEYIHEKE